MKPPVSAVFLGLLVAAGCGSKAPPAPPPMPTVTVATPITKQVVEWDAYTARVEPVEFVEVRARVSGYLKSIEFDEGQIVDKGDLLFVIDPRPFEAQLDAAKAAMGQAKSQVSRAEAGLAEAEAGSMQSDAQVELASVRVKRSRVLMQRSATSQEDLDQREAEYLQARADAEASRAAVRSARANIEASTAAVAAAEATIKTAELDLEYSRITSPVAGRISREYVNEGNLVSSGMGSPTLLTTITSMDPIYCVFDATEQDVLKYVRLAMSGERESSRVAKNPVFLGLIDEEGFPHQGHMNFVDNRFDANTASLRARAIFPNDEQLLLPGMFARIRIPGSAPHQAILIPDSAVGTDQSSQYVYVVVDGVIQRRAIKSGPIIDGLRVIRKGLEGNESLVIEGLLQSRPDAEVNVVQGTIEAIEDGLPDEYKPVPNEELILPASDMTTDATSEAT